MWCPPGFRIGFPHLWVSTPLGFRKHVSNLWVSADVSATCQRHFNRVRKHKGVEPGGLGADGGIENQPMCLAFLGIPWHFLVNYWFIIGLYWFINTLELLLILFSVNSYFFQLIDGIFCKLINHTDYLINQLRTYIFLLRSHK